MADLITLDRALQQIPTAQECDRATISDLIGVCTALTEKFCQRTFTQATFDELHSFQSATPYLFINNPPISSVNWVRSGQLPACYVQFADGNNTTQQATIQVTSTSVILKKIYNNVTTTNTFTFALYPTFTDLAAGINAVSGWTATVSAQFALWQTSDMVPQGAHSTRNVSTGLMVYWYYMSGYQFDRTELGQIYYRPGFVPTHEGYRVSYVGGYSVIPDDLQQAVAELVQLTFAATKTSNPSMQSETIDKYTYTRAAQTSFDSLSVVAKQTLNNYRIMKVARNKM